jgi:quercetin dioxygenase-like cupin family protein
MSHESFLVAPTERLLVMRNHEEPNWRPIGPDLPPPLKSMLPDSLEWRPFPAFPPEARIAVVAGRPKESGLYVIRVKVPNGIKLMPHRHPENRIYTVISGIFYVGVGQRFDERAVTAYPPGSVVLLPGDTPHFHWAKSGEYVTQVMGAGPLGIEYLDWLDDPRSYR